jgi:soluble lytic murein transglycosylase-like protein
VFSLSFIFKLGAFALVASGAMNCVGKTAIEPSPEVQNCLIAASAKHGISYGLLRSIAEQESSFNPLAIRAPMAAGNSDRSTDFGLMQINSSWLPQLARYGVNREKLFNPCINADVGAWILADNFRRMGVTWNAVGAYNAMTPWKRLKYANGVYSKLVQYSKNSANSHGIANTYAAQQERQSVSATTTRASGYEGVVIESASSTGDTSKEKQIASWEANRD